LFDYAYFTILFIAQDASTPPMPILPFMLWLSEKFRAAHRCITNI